MNRTGNPNQLAPALANNKARPVGKQCVRPFHIGRDLGIQLHVVEMVWMLTRVGPSENHVPCLVTTNRTVIFNCLGIALTGNKNRLTVLRVLSYKYNQIKYTILND